MDDAIRRIERLEERLNRAERDVATLTSKLTSTKDDLSRRLDELNRILREDVEKSREDLRERLIDLKVDLKDDIQDIASTLSVQTSNVSSVTESLQNLYASHKGSTVKVNTNEKIIWAVVGLIGSIGLYLLQSYLKTKGG